MNSNKKEKKSPVFYVFAVIVFIASVALTFIAASTVTALLS